MRSVKSCPLETMCNTSYSLDHMSKLEAHCVRCVLDQLNKTSLMVRSIRFTVHRVSKAKFGENVAELETS